MIERNSYAPPRNSLSWLVAVKRQSLSRWSRQSLQYTQRPLSHLSYVQYGGDKRAAFMTCRPPIMTSYRRYMTASDSSTDKTEEISKLHTLLEQDGEEAAAVAKTGCTPLVNHDELVDDPLSSEVIHLMDTLQERPYEASERDIADLCPENADRLTEEECEQLQTVLESGFTANLLKLYLASVGQKATGTKRKMTDRILEYWRHQSARQRVVRKEAEYDTSTVKGRIFYYDDIDSSYKHIEKHEYPITKEAIQYMDKYDSTLLERVRLAGPRVDIDRNLNVLYLAGTEDQVRVARNQLQKLLTPVVKTLTFPTILNNTLPLPVDKLDKLQGLLGVLINANVDTTHQVQTVQLVGDTKQNVDIAASALECLNENEKNYALLPVHDSFGMPFVSKYAAPFRIVDYTTQNSSSEETTEKNILSSDIALLQHDKAHDDSTPSNLYNLSSVIESLAEKSIDNGFTVSGLAKYGYGYFYCLDQLGALDALALPTRQSLTINELTTLLDASNSESSLYKSAFLTNYSMSQVTGQLHDLIRPKQYVELEYVTPHSTAHGIRIQMSIADDGHATIEQIAQFTLPYRTQLLLPTRASDILFELQATKLLTPSDNILDQFVNCQVTSDTYNNIPDVLDNTLLSSLSLVSNNYGDESTSMRINAIRRVSEQQRGWHNLWLKARRTDEIRQSISLYESMLLTSPISKQSTDTTSDLSSLRSLLVEAIGLVYES
ncbi:hypothetical protein BDF22DRAFT_698271 [Syncephalis plumigaleata]|nr:hypothetical protein BDF22DRAFT_698271 [Syncephalis plumigaleata]